MPDTPTAPSKDNPSIDVAFAQAFSDPAASNDDGQKPSGEQQQADPSNNGQTVQKGDDASQESPLKGIKFADILKDPDLQAEANSWKDKATSTAVQTALSRAEEKGRTEGKQQVVAEQRNTFFAGFVKMSPEERARELAADDTLAADYGRWQAEQEAAKDNTSEVAAGAEQYAMLMQIQLNNSKLSESGLAPEKLADLDPKLFAAEGAQGIVKWTKAIDDALLADRVAKATSSNNDEHNESEREQQRAEEDAQRGRALAGNGRSAAPLPDLMKTSTNKLFAQAFGG